MKMTSVRRLLAGVILFALLLTCAACTEAPAGPSTDAPATTAPATAPAATEPVVTEPKTVEPRHMTIACLGDSQTNYDGEALTYVNFLGDEELILDAQNVGLSGSAMGIPATKGYNQPFCKRMGNIKGNPDVILVFGGANDYGHSVYPVTLGEVESDNVDCKSFCSAIRYIIETLRAKYPDALIVFANQLPRDNARWYEKIEGSSANAFWENAFGYTPDQYADAMIAICDKYDVPVIDTYRYAPLNGADKTINMTYFKDGLHLNDEGHKILASYFTDCLKTILAEQDA